MSGFIIAQFLVLFTVIFIMNKIKNNNVSSSTADSSISISEPISSSSDDGSSSPSSDIDPYINEKAIIDNLLSLAREYDDKVIDISTLSFDSDYLYLFTSTSDSYLYIMTIELNSYDIDEALEMLITSKDNFEVTSILDTYTLEDTSIDITTLDVFKNNDAYRGYTYKNIYNYYLDSIHEVMALSAIGYKDNSYISIINVRYDTVNEELITIPIDGYNSVISDNGSEYYRVLEYLYHIKI